MYNYFLLRGSFPPPNIIILDHIRRAEITFSWSNVEHDGCSSFHYAVNGDNCGTCFPLSTTTNSSTCTNLSSILLSENNICNFTVQSVVCDDTVGDSNHAFLLLKGILLLCVSLTVIIILLHVLAYS